jgi:hypothetical protein
MLGGDAADLTDVPLPEHADEPPTVDPPSNRIKSPPCVPSGWEPDVLSAVTSLDPLETNRGHNIEDAPGRATQYPSALNQRLQDAPRFVAESFRHSGWHRDRVRVYKAMQDAAVPAARLNRFANCGDTYHVLRSTEDPSKHRLAAHACHDRFCKVCGGERSRLIARNTRDYLKGAPSRFITLTLRNDGRPLADLLKHLYASFTALRKTKLWKTTQTGGVAFLEVKRSPKTGLWHPHLHVLSQGKYIDQPKLSTAWKAVTGDSHIVDIRLVRDEASAVTYVTKYASKPMDGTVTDEPAHLIEALHALKGVHTVLTFGKWRGMPLHAKPEEGKWERVCTLSELAVKAVNGDAEALALLKQLTGDHAPHWLTAARIRDGCPSSVDDVDLEGLSFVDLDSIPF